MVARKWLVRAILGGSLAACGSAQQGFGRSEAGAFGGEPVDRDPHPRRDSSDAGTSVEGEERLFDEASAELARGEFVEAVLARNPTVRAAREAWRAARQRRVQSEALEDPMLSYSFAPLSIGSSMRYGQVVELSQRFPWPGKLGSLGEEAEAEARAAAEQYEVVGLDLALAASMLFDQYYLVERELEVNREHQDLLEQLQRSARAHYGAGRGSLQDPLAAEVERLHREHDEIVLKTERAVTIARMNALLHRAPSAPLPRAPRDLAVSMEEPPPSPLLQRRALKGRAELRARAARVRAFEARTEYAGRAYFPDLTVMFSYNSMWESIEHQLMLGVAAPIPIQRGSRAGAVDEATALGAEARQELKAESIEIRREVDVARARIIEALHVALLYEGKLLPLASDQLRAAQAGFEADVNDFSAVITAENRLREAQLNYYTAKAELSKRRAELERALGQLPGVPGRSER